MNKKFGFILMIFLGTLLFACEADKELSIISKEASIDKYIETKFKDSTIVKNKGVYRVLIDKSTIKDSLEYGDSLAFFYAGFIFNNGPSQIFATNNMAAAEQLNFNLTNLDFSVKKVKFSEDVFVTGLERGMFGVREGEHSIIVFSPRYGFENEIVYNIPRLSSLMYVVWIQEIKKKNI